MWIGPLAAAALLLVGGWLARDVLAPTTPAAGGEAAPDATWPELEALASAALQPDARPAPALVRLAELAPVPSRFRARYDQVEEALVARLHDAQAAFVRRLGSEVDRLVDRRDFVGALAQVSPEGFARRAREELDVDAVQLVQLERSARPQELRGGIERELEAHVAGLRRRIDEHLRQVVQARADNDVRDGHWRAAYALVSSEPAEVLADAGIVTAGLPADRVELLESGVRARQEELRAALEARWRELDAALAGWVEDLGARLSEELRARSPRDRSAADELAERYQQHCAELGLVPGERLDRVADQAPQVLERVSGELVALERALVEEDAAAWLATTRKAADELRGARRYGELAETWARALDQDWLAPVRDEVEQERLAARLVDELLQRAARGVLAADGETRELVVRSIQVKGRIEAGGDPLALGFDLVAPSTVGTIPLALRPREPAGGAAPYLLPPASIEDFAGLAPEPARDDPPEDRLARALLRYYEGDIAGARAFLPVPRSDDRVLDAVADHLRQEVSRRGDELEQEREQRLGEARVRIQLALRMAAEARHEQERQDAIRAIDEVLDGYGDLEPVQASADKLRRRRAELAAPPRPPQADDFREAFSPTSVSLEGGEVSLGFDFGAADEGAGAAYERAWNRGSWMVDADGWIARGLHSLDEVLEPKGWPRLVLRPPLDLDGPLEVAFTFEQPQDSGLPQLLVASVAGVHVALRGEQGGQRARVDMAAGGPDELRRLVAQVDSGGKGKEFAGLVRGGRYTLVVSLTGQRGRAVARLTGPTPDGGDYEGRIIDQLVAPRPEGKPGTASLVVRSIERVRLLEASVHGRAVAAY